MKRIIAIILMLAILSASIIAGVLVVKDEPTSTEVKSYNWKSYLKNDAEWFASSEAESIAADILKYQLSDGGWRKDMANEAETGAWASSTLDNDATTSQISFLARCYQQTGKSKYLKACLKGIDLLLDGQYANGGFPQIFGKTSDYHTHITYNDGAMIHAMYILRDVSEKAGDFSFVSDKYAERAKSALEKGIRCILDTQIIVNGVKTAWCQQHDEFTLAPAKGRSYELPSISASESVSIVNFLRELPNKTDEINESIDCAIQWMKEVRIYGIKVLDLGDDRVVIEDENAGPIWARFYEIGTNKPLFVDRDGSIHDELAGISQERRSGYAWYGSWPSKLTEK